MIPLAVIRPEPGCTTTLAAARLLGLEAHGFPLFEIAPLAWDAPDPAGFDALLLGSANALRHGGEGLARYRGLPAYAVGAATAEAARAKGLDVVAAGEGGLQGVLDAIRPGHRRLLRLAGRERVALAAPPGVVIEERVVYASEPLAMPGALAGLLQGPAVVLLHSAAAARHFAAQCDARGIGRGAIALAAIGPQVAQAAGGGWAAARWPDRPSDPALLALAREMCQSPADGTGSEP